MVIGYQFSIEHNFIKHERSSRTLDIDLLSPEDYTLTCDIKPELWNAFIDKENHNEDSANELSNLGAFRDALIQAVETNLKAQLDTDELVVAAVNFDFDNPDLLSILRDRADALHRADFDSLKLYNITSELNRQKNTNLLERMTPTQAFIIFAQQKRFQHFIEDDDTKTS